MVTPQAGIVPQPNPYALFLILRVLDPRSNGPGAAAVAASVPALVGKVAAKDRGAGLVCTVGFGPEFWDVISSTGRPRALRPFRAIETGERRAPNTGGDLLFHIISRRQDLNFELAMRIRSRLGQGIEVLEEVHGFRYLDSRDLTGFIDGTENPKGKERAKVALIGAEDQPFSGGSYVFTQRYVHNLRLWASVPEKEQEGVIGRRKTDSKELSDRIKPATAHISRVVIEEDGEELQIVRHSFPYGTTSEAGLFFIAYSKNPDIPEKMLGRMMGAGGDGLHDHLMNYSRAVSGAVFFAPSLELLKSFAPPRRRG